MIPAQPPTVLPPPSVTPFPNIEGLASSALPKDTAHFGRHLSPRTLPGHTLQPHRPQVLLRGRAVGVNGFHAGCELEENELLHVCDRCGAAHSTKFISAVIGSLLI